MARGKENSTSNGTIHWAVHYFHFDRMIVKMKMTAGRGNLYLNVGSKLWNRKHVKKSALNPSSFKTSSFTP
jgi:hypothetical protein